VTRLKSTHHLICIGGGAIKRPTGDLAACEQSNVMVAGPMIVVQPEGMEKI